MGFWEQRTREEKAVVLMLVFLVYLATADAGHALHAATASALIFSPSGIALAVTLLLGYPMLGAVALASFVFSFFVDNYPLTVALGLAIANTIQPFLAAYVLERLSFNTGLARLRDASLLIVVAVIGGTIVPTLGSIILVLSGTISVASASASWGAWYAGELLSLLILAPFLVRWLPKLRFRRTRNEWIEVGLALASVVAISAVLFWTPYGVVAGVPLVYLLLLPMIWIAVRLGPRMTTVGLLLMTLIALSGTLVRTAPAVLDQTVFSIELLLSILAIIFLLLAALAEERKDATAALRKQLVRLEDALEKIRGEDQAKSDFLAVLAHELRNPLAPLLSSLELLRLTEQSPKTRETVNAMRGRVRTMARLLDDLLDVTRVTHGKLVLRTAPIDLVGVARRAVETIEPEMAPHRHTFTVKFPKGAVRIIADPVRIEQIIVNLLNNAVKYTNDGGTIELAVSTERKTAVISVKDSGAGIVSDMLDRIFEPFRQGEAARRMSTGLGIGLALSKNLVELHGGTIQAKSAGPGRGSEMIVRLPLGGSARRDAPKRLERSQELKRMPPGNKALKVLIIDDNRAAADALLALLSHIGHKTQVAYDGASGITHAATFAPHAILLDIGLPDMEGYEVAQKLKAKRSPAVLIALTGYGQKEDRQRALGAGFAHHLTKPVGLVELEGILRKIPTD